MVGEEKPGARSQKPEVATWSATHDAQLAPARSIGDARAPFRPGTRRNLRLLFWLLACGFWLLLPTGCASDGTNDDDDAPHRSTVRQRQDDALRDPMGYEPGMDEHDISGGGLTDFDREGFNNDLDRVLNP